MGTDEPTVAILLATFRPRLDWLEEQLRSLNAQTWPSVCLYVRDDCSEPEEFEAIRSLLDKHIRRFPYMLYRNKENLGSNKTFELLTKEATGDYFAYCDQDDIWLPDKIKNCVHAFSAQEHVVLVNSDMLIIDGDGIQMADSIMKIRPHHRFWQGTGFSEELVFTNFVTGCSMMIASETAKAAVPFCPYMVHDHYLALFCSTRGAVVSLEEPQLKYRVHGANQTRELAGVTNKETYVRQRIQTPRRQMEWLLKKLDCDEALRSEIMRLREWYGARESYMLQGTGAGTVWKYRHYSPVAASFELIAGRLPNCVFMLGVQYKQKRIRR